MVDVPGYVPTILAMIKHLENLKHFCVAFLIVSI